MPKNFFNKLKESFMSSSSDRGNKSDDFEKAKEVLFSSKNTQQLISAVKFINNFNKKWDIREGSPEFIYFERMIKLMRTKIRNNKLEGGNDLDESSRLDRSVKNIIKESLDDLSWIEDAQSSFDPNFIFKGKEYWIDIDGLSDEEKILIREYILKITNYRSSRPFRKNEIKRYKGFIVHCGTDSTDYEPEEDEICYLEVSFDEDEYKDNSIYVDGREVLEYINLTNDDEELDESLEWTDKDNSYGNDERYSNDGSWKADDNWTPNPDKSYWKQGSVGGGSSSGGESVSEGIDDLGWIKDIEEYPNYNGFPQGVVYVGSHEEIDMLYELIEKINPKNFTGRGNINSLHQGLEDSRDEIEAEGYDSSDIIISISFFVEKEYPGGLSFGYWSYDVGEDMIYEWLSHGDTFSRDYRLYNSVYDLKKDISHLIKEDLGWGWVQEDINPWFEYNVIVFDITPSKEDVNTYIEMALGTKRISNDDSWETSRNIDLNRIIEYQKIYGKSVLMIKNYELVYTDGKHWEEFFLNKENYKEINYTQLKRNNINESKQDWSWVQDIPGTEEYGQKYKFFDIYVCYGVDEDDECVEGYSAFIKIPTYQADEIWDGYIDYMAGPGDEGEGVIKWAIENEQLDWDDIVAVDYVREIDDDEYVRATGDSNISSY